MQALRPETKVLALVLAGLATASAVKAADDTFENNNPGTAYNDGIAYGDNGGSGFGALTYLEGTGGGLFNSTLTGARALGVFAGGGGGNTQALGRTISTPLLTGVYTFQLRLDVDNATAFSGVNLKSSLGAAFGTGELLSIGLTPATGNTSLLISGATSQSLALGVELRGTNLDVQVTFNSTLATYSVTAKRTIDATFAVPVTGSLKDTNGAAVGTDSLAALGFGNFNTGANQNLTIDNLSVVPEPGSAATLVGGLGVLGLLRRRHATH